MKTEGFTRQDIESMLAKLLATPITDTTTIIQTLQELTRGIWEIFSEHTLANLFERGENLLSLPRDTPEFMKEYKTFLEDADSNAIHVMKEAGILEEEAQAAQDHIVKIAKAAGIKDFAFADNSQREALNAINTFISQVEGIHPSEILQGVTACCELGEQLHYRGIVETTSFPMALELRGSLSRGGLYSSEEFQAHLKTYAQILWSVNRTIWECMDRLPEGMQDAEDVAMYDACDAALDHTWRIARCLGFNENAETAKDTITPLWLNPVVAWMQRCPSAENMLSHWETARQEKPSESKPLEKRKPSAAFNTCAHFDETVKGYQAEAVNVLRRISERVTALARHCAEKITPDARQDALLFSERASHAAESISGK